MNMTDWVGHHTGAKIGLITESHNGPCVAAVCFGKGESEDSHRKIALIAAAPELLAACRACADVILNHATRNGKSLASSKESGFEAYQKACAAIAKAEGGAP
jgi:hypothetical protein